MRFVILHGRPIVAELDARTFCGLHCVTAFTQHLQFAETSEHFKVYGSQFRAYQYQHLCKLALRI